LSIPILYHASPTPTIQPPYPPPPPPQRLHSRVSDLRQLKRDLPEQRVGGTVAHPHFDDAALEMLFTSLPARTTNALEYIAFQVKGGGGGHVLHITHRTSHVTRHTSQFTDHTSHITHHTSHITHHTSHITHHQSIVTNHASQERYARHVTLSAAVYEASGVWFDGLGLRV
jgi:hypothetical protein